MKTLGERGSRIKAPAWASPQLDVCCATGEDWRESATFALLVDLARFGRCDRPLEQIAASLGECARTLAESITWLRRRFWIDGNLRPTQAGCDAHPKRPGTWQLVLA